VLNTAQLKIAQELVHSQNVYARGVLHYIYRCSLKLLKMHHRRIDVDDFSSDLWTSTLVTVPTLTSLSSAPLMRIHTASKDGFTYDDKSRSLDLQPMGFVDADPSPLSKLMQSSSLQGGLEWFAREDPLEVQLDRISELIEDMTLALSASSLSLSSLPSSTSQIVPFIHTREGTLFCYSDFVTGLVEMNRSFTHNQLASDAKRSLLLGADFIVS